LYGQEWTGIKTEVYELLNDRQQVALDYIREHGKIDNATYKQITNVSRTTAFRDLKELVDKKLIKQAGSGGPDTYYILSQ